uniref:Uncharacterized protein n=1 Tax=Anguilla anguilla TaxID=7936 RepID=A0A0E9PI20_ANGAN
MLYCMKVRWWQPRAIWSSKLPHVLWPSKYLTCKHMH